MQGRNSGIQPKEKDSIREEFIVMCKPKKRNIEKRVTDVNNHPYMTLAKNIAIILGGVAVIMAAVFRVVQSQTSIEANEKAIVELKKSVESINYSINGNPETGALGINSRLDTIEGYIEIVKLSASKSTLTLLGELSVEKNNVVTTSVSAFASDDVLGVDEDGKEHLVKDYVDEPILLTYTEDGKEVFFLGQYNDNYQWNGYCITNAYYTDGTLFGICESNFDNGKRLDYKSFVHDEKEEWIYSNRICEEDYNSGENKNYQYVCSNNKNFTTTNVRVTDIFSVDDYLNKHDMTIMSEYQGNTADGKYNDITGKAYYIRYYEDGTVMTLYQGNVVEGKLDDSTGHAWQIACNRDNGALYQYYQGPFENDEKVEKDNPDYNQLYLTKDDIDKILKEKNCKLKLKWDEQSLMSQ